MSIDVIKLAEKAGFTIDRVCTSNGDCAEHIKNPQPHSSDCTEAVNLFAAMMLEEAARLCEAKVGEEYATGKVDHNEIAWTLWCAIAIRALKPQE